LYIVTWSEQIEWVNSERVWICE